MADEIWNKCVSRLEAELPREQFTMWIKPLQVASGGGDDKLTLLAPNKFIVDWVCDKYLAQIKDIMAEVHEGTLPSIDVKVGDARVPMASSASKPVRKPAVTSNQAPKTFSEVATAVTQGDEGESSTSDKPKNIHAPKSGRSTLNSAYTFDSFVEGKSNQMAAAAAQQVAESPGAHGYNPLLLYGDVGLGKTHLMQAVGHEILRRNPNANVIYLHSERFVGELISGLRNKTINEFKRFYRNVDALLIDDIQFFVGKKASQEEFFHTFNALIENGQQVILTCDKFPKEIDGLEERLKSRFGWGLSQPMEPPELEMRVAILKKKAEEVNAHLPDDAAFFIAQRIRSNVRELEGALKRVLAHSNFSGQPITIPLIKEALRDLLQMQARQINIDNIQRIVAEYYKIKTADLLSPRRSRSVARPRQIAMALTKELTRNSYPEIGHAFGGRDHTTVLHACRRVQSLRKENTDIEEDYQNLLRSLTS